MIFPELVILFLIFVLHDVHIELVLDGCMGRHQGLLPPYITDIDGVGIAERLLQEGMVVHGWIVLYL